MTSLQENVWQQPLLIALAVMLLSLLPSPLLAQPSTLSAPLASQASKAFIHPGIAHTAASIDIVKEKIATDDQLWQNAFTKLQRSRHGQLTWKPDPRPHVQRGVRNLSLIHI